MELARSLNYYNMESYMRKKDSFQWFKGGYNSFIFRLSDEACYSM